MQFGPRCSNESHILVLLRLLVVLAGFFLAAGT